MGEEGLVVRLRGLPWSASQEEVANFLEDCNIVGGLEGVHFTYVRDGRPSGEAYVELETEDDLYNALKKDKHHMGKRYVDVFQSKRSEMDWVVKRSGSTASDEEAVIRLRGLPFGCSKEEIAQFFTGLEIVPNGITLLRDLEGRETGDAFVQFASSDLATEALSKHKGRIGHRYIVIFKSSQMEVRNALTMMNKMKNMDRMWGGGGSGGRPSPYDRGDRYGGGGMGASSSRGGMGYRGGRGRGNVKGFYDDGFDDFGGGYGGCHGGGRQGSSSGGMRSNRGMDSYESQTGHCIHMRGLPFAATEQDVLDFFKPLNPVNVFLHIQPDGRASGEADVDFSSHDEAKDGMSRDRATMQHRYVELFLKSSASGDKFGGGYGNGMSNPNYTAF